MRRVFRIAALLLAAAGCRGPQPATYTKASGDTPKHYDLGSVATSAQLAAYDIDVDTLGRGLPAGQGSAARGAEIYRAKCAMCHGLNGEGLGNFPKLVGREPGDSFAFGRDAKLVKTIGNYWPYATTLYDYVHRAMPLTAPGSLKPEEVYSLVAFLLARNAIIDENVIIDRASLPKVQMPARRHFVRDDRTGGREFR